MSHDAYSALSDPTRRRILAVLHGGARPVGDLVTELGVSQPTVSKHLKVLRDAGMVTTRAEGQKRFYSIVAEPFIPVVQWLTDLVATAQAQDGTTTADAPVSEREPGAETPDLSRPPEAQEPNPSRVPAADPEGLGEATPLDTGADPDPETVPEGTTGPEATPEPQPRSVPWFTAETAEVVDAATPAGEQDTGEADAGGAAAGEAGAVEVELTEIEITETSGAELDDDTGAADLDLTDASASDAPAAEAPTAEASTAEVGGADEVRGGVVEPAAAGGAETGPESAAASVGDDVHAESAAQRPAERQDEPRDIHTRDALEEIEAPGNEEMMRPRGGAHRRQSGLLSTLTGFRRRGRGSRRD
ncbi:helix-turn-helix transcriptional regulator [Kocuria sp.]|uniref:ArsR/SmtB family transcription factor n=1 Tax=Kocuria sp. TaxID=1871328 RepID=UPI0026DCFC14|nr:metalloregulator ArsR/SmtB family transcription factor [Kocuria sp.]MDO4918316.1 metalloregulator ArsR/SmtB family transcription factor [Kocuria sp.]